MTGNLRLLTAAPLCWLGRQVNAAPRAGHARCEASPTTRLALSASQRHLLTAIPSLFAPASNEDNSTLNKRARLRPRRRKRRASCAPRDMTLSGTAVSYDHYYTSSYISYITATISPDSGIGGRSSPTYADDAASLLQQHAPIGFILRHAVY